MSSGNKIIIVFFPAEGGGKIRKTVADDQIIVLTDEGVKERGTHAELLAKNGIYAGLYQYQFRE